MCTILQGSIIATFSNAGTGETKTGTVRHVIAQVALVKTEFRVHLMNLHEKATKIGIATTRIILVVKDDISPIEKILDGNHTVHILSITDFFHSLGESEINPVSAIIIFVGIDWSEVVRLFKTSSDIIVSGGNGTLRHLASQLSVRLNTFLLLMFNFEYNKMYNSLEFDYKRFKDKISPVKDFSKKSESKPKKDYITRIIRMIDSTE